MSENDTKDDLSEQTVTVEMTVEQWDVVIHALEEEMAQLAPPEGEWLGYAPGEEGAVAIGDAHEEIMEAVVAARKQG